MKNETFIKKWQFQFAWTSISAPIRALSVLCSLNCFFIHSKCREIVYISFNIMAVLYTYFVFNGE